MGRDVAQITGACGHAIRRIGHEGSRVDPNPGHFGYHFAGPLLVPTFGSLLDLACLGGTHFWGHFWYPFWGLTFLRLGGTLAVFVDDAVV